ncbi:hypothetical protein ACFXDH_09445 [Streptomyces sp. NPDC059467]|uniref:hypothetical protein n=1 Tax=Streptomyces sp. NPDC059467 TaxID=3346844 RepID=UPI0036D0B5F8
MPGFFAESVADFDAVCNTDVMADVIDSGVGSPASPRRSRRPCGGRAAAPVA